jgi:hypothetical protein
MSLNTRTLMTLSALFLAAAGVAITFLPQELMAHTGAQATPTAVLLIQLLGACYVGLAALNWMSRGAHIGGIYGRPLSMANFFHFAIGASALIKGAVALGFPLEVSVAAAVYAAFGAWFGVTLFTHPAPPSPA